MHSDEQKTLWEREVIENVLMASLLEQRKARRWNLAYRLLSLLIVAGTVLYLVSLNDFDQSAKGSGEPHTAVVDVFGMIMEDAPANANTIEDGLLDAVEDKETRGILLRMNSPGGSPVQSAYIYEAIRKLKSKHPELPVVAVVSDLCASGCYYAASAADKIYAHPTSVVGSIGVIMNGFGFVGTLEKLGVERRTLTAGAHKALLDPFAPTQPAEQAHVQGLINSVHQDFIAAVRQGRGDRLKEIPDMFSGLVWTGRQAKELGLIDDFGDERSVAEDVIGAKERVNYTPREKFWEKLGSRMGTQMGTALFRRLEESGAMPGGALR